MRYASAVNASLTLPTRWMPRIQSPVDGWIFRTIPKIERVEEALKALSRRLEIKDVPDYDLTASTAFASQFAHLFLWGFPLPAVADVILPSAHNFADLGQWTQVAPSVLSNSAFVNWRKRKQST